MEDENEFTTEDIILSGFDDDLDMDEMIDDDDLGRARRGRRRPIPRRRLPRRMTRGVRHELGASRFRRHFLDRVGQLPKPIQNALRRKKAQISDAPYYATAEIKGTRAELIKPSISEELGLTNIDNGKLNKDRHLTLSGIRLLYDADSIDGAFTDAYPVELLNAEWELELNGQKVFEKQPVRNFFDGFYGYNVNKPFGLYVLNNPKLVSPQTPIEFNVSLPSEIDGYLKVFFLGTAVYAM